MLLGFISLLLTATSSTIANICVPSSFYNDRFVPCTRSEIQEELESDSSVKRNLLSKPLFFNVFRRRLEGINHATCSEVTSMVASLLEPISHGHLLGDIQSILQGHEPFVSYQGLEQLHRFIFIMAVTHVTYSCLTMLLAIVKVVSLLFFLSAAPQISGDLVFGKFAFLLDCFLLYTDS